MNAHSGFIDKASAISDKKFISRFENFRNPFISRNQNVVLYGLIGLKR